MLSFCWSAVSFFFGRAHASNLIGDNYYCCRREGDDAKGGTQQCSALFVRGAMRKSGRSKMLA